MRLKQIIQIIKKAKVHAEDGFCTLTIKKDDESKNKLSDFIKSYPNSNMVLTNETITLILKEENLEYAKEMMGKAVIKVDKNLSMITLSFPKKARTTPGVYNFILNFLAEHDINLINFYGGYLDACLILSTKDRDRAQSLILNASA